MIGELRITDLGVIEEAALAFAPGLTVVTGETGAGKTMIISGLQLLLGERADAKTVRAGAERARVEGRFELPAEATRASELTAQVHELGGVLDDDELLVARQLTSAGRSRAFLGGSQVPAGICADLVSRLVTIHGQSDQIRLADRSRQREMLDRHAGPDQLARLAGYRTTYAEQRDAAAELTRLRTEEQERTREIELLRFGLEEIAKVAPQPGEDVALATEATRLQSTDDLAAHAQDATASLAGGDDETGGALAGLAAARSSVQRLAAIDPTAGPLAERVAGAGYLVSELTGELARYLDGLDTEPGRLEQIASRRYELAGLTRRYGASCDEVLAWAEKSAARLVALESADDRIAELTDQVAALTGRLAADAQEIRRGRRAAADQLAERTGPELAALALPHARLAFELTETEPGPDGADQVELLFRANPGGALRPLGRAASGGELSRVRLALEVVLADHRTHSFNEGATLVFDEVDAGVGGQVAVEVGRRLAALARHRQVIVVTHLAQVAAFADRHFVVVKASDGQVTTSGVRLVADGDRAGELARMMAGLDTTAVALAHAGELLDLAAGSR